MKKAKGQTIDLLYTNKKETDKKTKNKPKNTIKKKKSKAKTRNNSTEKINLDNEIIIGLTPRMEENKKQTKKKNPRAKNNQKVKAKSNRDNSRKNKKKDTKKIQASKNRNTSKSRTKNKVPKKKRNLKAIKWISIIILFVAVVILFMMSSIFNIKQIVVLNNSKISSEEIINLSTLTPGINMFKTTNKTIKNSIKSNAYIEDVSIKRNVNGTVTLDVKERTTTYMLKFANAYVYINNQGYMLEVSETPLELPIITGFQTSNEDMKAGNRLVVDDLNRLDDVIKIMESAKNSSLADIITEVDISDPTNYKLTIESEGKTVQFGDISNINIKLQMVGQIINSEEGKTGEIYFQEDAKKAVFKEEVSR